MTTSRFHQSLLDPETFTLTFELVPSRGGHSKEQQRIVELARTAAADGRLQAVSITENAGGHPALSPEVLGLEIKQMGLDVITHFSCKDKNRNQMESLLFAWDRAGLDNLLVLSGDYPQKGFCGHPKPVFDLDSVQALHLLSRMNQGRFDGYKTDHPDCPFRATTFLKGVAVSPFKLRQEELLPQYYKLHRKKAAGADYIITQLGFDARKYHELLLYVQDSGLDLPILGNVFIPNLTVARLMHEGKIPGCIIPAPLYRQILDEARGEDRGKTARLTRAAKLLAILRGMGYAGAHIGGPGLTFADLDSVLRQADQLAPGWHRLVDEFRYWPEDAAWLYARDPATGLNRRQRLRQPSPRRPLPGYRLAKWLHNLLFASDGPLYNSSKKLCLALQRHRAAPLLAALEHGLKNLAFGCRNCGDCTLSEFCYLCPQYGCAKYLLNGPCGGSIDGWCEVYPGIRKCFYVKWYERAAADGRAEQFARGYLPPRNWALYRTSSWINYYTGQDHTGQGANCRPRGKDDQ